jgi:hypothetical protein
MSYVNDSVRLRHADYLFNLYLNHDCIFKQVNFSQVLGYGCRSESLIGDCTATCSSGVRPGSLDGLLSDESHIGRLSVMFVTIDVPYGLMAKRI